MNLKTTELSELQRLSFSVMYVLLVKINEDSE